MKRRREPKKSETLEVRLPHEVKTALMRKAQVEGRSASEVVRQSIAAYLAEQPKEARSMSFTAWKPAAAGGVISAAILWTALATAPAIAAPDLRAAFADFDRDGNKVLTLDEFLVRSPDTLYVMKADRPSASGSAKPLILPLRKELPAPPPGATKPPEQFLRSEFGRHDADRDGKVTFGEFEQFHLAIIDAGFAALDTNRDGMLDRAEFDSAVKGGPHAPSAAAFGDIDADGDGRVSKEEFLG